MGTTYVVVFVHMNGCRYEMHMYVIFFHGCGCAHSSECMYLCAHMCVRVSGHKEGSPENITLAQGVW